jgi:hypothetical protein
MFKMAVNLSESRCVTVILVDVSTNSCDFKHALRVNSEKRGFYVFNKTIRSDDYTILGLKKPPYSSSRA